MRQEHRCVCGAATWRDGACQTCGLPEGAREQHYLRLMARAFPPLDRVPFTATAGAFAQGTPVGVPRSSGRVPTAGTPAARIAAAISAAPAGLRMDELLHATGLAWEQVYPLVGEMLDRKALVREELAKRMSQGELAAGSVRFTRREG